MKQPLTATDDLIQVVCSFVGVRWEWGAWGEKAKQCLNKTGLQQSPVGPLAERKAGFKNNQL